MNTVDTNWSLTNVSDLRSWLEAAGMGGWEDMAPGTTGLIFEEESYTYWAEVWQDGRIYVIENNLQFVFDRTDMFIKCARRYFGQSLDVRVKVHIDEEKDIVSILLDGTKEAEIQHTGADFYLSWDHDGRMAQYTNNFHKTMDGAVDEFKRLVKTGVLPMIEEATR